MFSKKSSFGKTIGSIDGATALKLEEEVQLDLPENNFDFQTNKDENIAKGISIENASYIDSQNLQENEIHKEEKDINETPVETIEDSPKLFSEETAENIEDNDEGQNLKDNLFEQENNAYEEDDFEIPAFLRKQKF